MAADRSWRWVVVVAALLLWPALWNGYPIVFADTGTYLSQAIHRYAGWDRPVFYSVFMLPLHATVTLWPVVAAQALLAAWVLRLVCRVLAPDLPDWLLLAGGAGLSLFTWLPWLVSELMPDLFTPLLVLILAVLAWTPDRVTRREWLALPALATLMTASQQSSLPLAFGLSVALGLAAGLTDRTARPAWGLRPDRAALADASGGSPAGLRGSACRGTAMARMRRAWRLTIVPPALAVLALCSVNLVAHGRFSVSPFGNVFLLARVIYDGPGLAALRQGCPEAGWRLCPFLDRLPPTSDDFLWQPGSPLDLAGGAKAVSGDANAIIGAALVADPVGEARAALGNTLEQLRRFDSGDGLEPWPTWVTPWIKRDFPLPENARYAAALQQNGRLAVPWALGLGHKIAGLAGVAGCALLLPVAIRRRSACAGFLIAALLALPLNAAITGSLSAPHERYQSRVMWLPPFVAALSLASLRRRQT